MVYNASAVEAYRNFGDRYFYLKSQAVWAVVGLGLTLFISRIKYSFFKKTGLIWLLISWLLLILVLFLAPEIQGAKRWLSVGGFFSLQPSELVKLTFIIYLASWLSARKRPFSNFLLLVGLTCGLVILEPDLGTALVIGVVAFAVYYVSGAPLLKFFAVTCLGIITVAGLILISPYRRQRLLTFFDPTQDPLGSSYHIRQALIALGSGGFWGVGLGQSRQKYSYLPEVATDSIFAIIAEEIGFSGSVVLLGLMGFLVYQLFTVAWQAPDRFARLLTTGIATWLGFQIFFNLAAMVALVPLTGIPLPLISYGGSSLLINLIAIGIVLNISRYTQPRIIKRRKV